MKKTIAALAVAGTLALGACEFDITDPNSPSPIGPNATRAEVDAASVGLLIALRADVANWVLKAAVLGREGYRLDTADPRFVSELLQGPLDASNNAFGGGQWQPEFRTITRGYDILNVIGSAQVSAAEQAAVSGFVETIQALSFLTVLNAHTQDSIPIDVNRTIDEPLAPFVTNNAAYLRVLSLLDSAQTHLLAGGASFPFNPGPGFTGLNTPALFLQFNRALAARVQAYRASPNAPGVNCTACWDTVITAVQQSFMDTTASLDFGAYNVFSTGNQDAPNPLSQNPASAVNVVHPFVRDSVELQAGGSPFQDKRYLSKVTARGTPLTLSGHTSDLSWIRYPSPNSPIPIIRNEELILLWAEARLGQGNLLEAARFINFIRRVSGGLDTIPNLGLQSAAAIRDQLLKQRLYSLLYEGGHRWIDMRRYGRLNQIIVDRPAVDQVFTTLPINSFEVDARQP